MDIGSLSDLIQQNVFALDPVDMAVTKIAATARHDFTSGSLAAARIVA